MEDLVRCPYCLSGNEFRPMVFYVDDTYICDRCGHTIRPKDKSYHCGCSGCIELKRSTA
jgi:DNA-directed RNA polymerase subunit RPC12/RpoP